MDKFHNKEQKKGNLLGRIYFYLFLNPILLVLLLGCSAPSPKNQNKVKDDLYIIDVESVYEKTEDILLSEVSTNINYIPLETLPDNLLSGINQIEITESYIFVSDRNKLLQFTREGRFIRQIGNIGRGPGEYTSIMNFAINEESNMILVNGEHRFNMYDLNGNFKHEIHNPPGGSFIIYKPNRIAFYCINYTGQPINLIITDQELKPLFEFQNHDPRPQTSLKFNAPLYSYDKELYIKENFNDTLFSVKDSVQLAHIIFNEKELLLDKDFDLISTGNVSDLIDQIDKVKNKLMTKSIFESKRFVFTEYKIGVGPRDVRYMRVLFDKKSNNTYATDNDGFINDVDGGVKIWPLKICQDSLMVNYLDAFAFKDYVSTDAFKNSNPKYPEKKKQLEQLANSLDINDNPVLMLVKLKE